MRIRGIHDQALRENKTREKSRGVSFAKVMKEQEERGELHFSAHAEERFRPIKESFGPARLETLKNAVTSAEKKGANTTLVLMKGAAFVVAPKSGTVITVVPEDRMQQNVFTSIDSAILAEK